MKGLATVRLLAELERHTGKRIHEMFDLIGGVERVGGCMRGLEMQALAFRLASGLAELGCHLQAC
jgi:patatin-like phospholipase/acyl hydrolase